MVTTRSGMEYNNQEQHISEFMRRIRLLGETLQFNEDIPSWDYIQGENLFEGGLPSYEEATDPIPSYEDVIQEKYWENKLKIKKLLI